MASEHHDNVVRDFHDELQSKGHISDEGETPLNQVPTSGTGTVTISADLFEKLYLQPKIQAHAVSHPLQKLFGNPTPLGLIGFELSLMPIVMQLMGWHGSPTSRSVNNANVIFFGGILMWIAGLLEFILGNTFPFLVFTTYGSFYAAYAGTMIPWFNTYGPFSTDPEGAALAGLADSTFNAAYAHYWSVFGILAFLMFVCSLRTNIAFVLLFGTIVPGIGLLAAVFYHVADGNAAKAHDCQVAAGGVLFSTTLIGWYILAGLFFQSVDFPLSLPLGDLQGVIPGLTEIRGGHKSGRSVFRKNKKRNEVEDQV